jgi:hypothetical protein
MRRKWWVVLFAPPLIVLFIFVGGEIVKLLWNWLLPPLFNVHQITFWQGLGILILARILFGGIGRHGSSDRPFFRRHMRERMAERMGKRMAERWEQMTPEERERFRQGMGRWCDFGASAVENKPQNEAAE